MMIFVAKVLTIFGIVFMLVLGGEPEMQTGEIQITITQGLDAILPCLINFADVSSAQLGKYKVLWSDETGRYISVDVKVMADQRKYQVLHDVPNEWNLKIKGVRSSDAGKYKCQVNSIPVQTQYVILHVNVPPRITSSETVSVKEGDQLIIYCNVTGIPKPTVTWSRDGKDFLDQRGEMFMQEKTVRTDSGLYRCEADNGIEPSDSEDIIVDVHYTPEVYVRTSRINQYRYRTIILECIVTANPQETVTWYRNGNALGNNWKYKAEATKYESEKFSQADDSRLHSLHITYLDRHDFGDYLCMAVNSVGTASGIITVNELFSTTLPPTTPKPTTTTSAKVKQETSTSVTYIVDPGSTTTRPSLSSPKSETIPDTTGLPGNSGQKDKIVVAPDSSSVTFRVAFPMLLLHVCVLRLLA